MTKIWVDEAYALDYLCILLVKRYKFKQEAPYLEFLEKMEIAPEILIDIFGSLEFKKLYDVNLCLFDTIDKIRRGHKMDAQVVDDLNKERWLAKREIQTRFFSSSITETKNYLKST